MHPSAARRLLPFLCALASLALAVLGCGQADEIRHYQALRLKQPEIKPTDQMLAAIVLPSEGEKSPGAEAAAPSGGQPAGQPWFFKLAGPIAEVEPLAEMFQKFIGSIHFVDGKPQFDVPSDWKARGASQMRYETFEIPTTDKPLELTVTTLPRGEDDETAFLLNNINRWRGQMGLPPTGEEQLADSSQRLPLDGATATLVSLIGKLKAGGMGAPMAPFAGGNPHPPLEHNPNGRGAPAAGDSSGDSSPGDGSNAGDESGK